MTPDPSRAAPGTDADGVLEAVLALVAERRGVDFRDYRRETVRNRLELRVKVAGCADLPAYLARLPGDPRELDKLVEALVIPVTRFFRDPEVFRDLADHVLPALVSTASFVRAWVVGAATGEEAYTVAILLAEAAARQRGAGFEVIASDLDERSLATGREGRYPESALALVPAELRGRYFRREGSAARVVDLIRGRVRFARHDLVGGQLAPKEAIVAAFDAVFCRNVLIYFDTSLRLKAAHRLAAVLEPHGVLVLGLSEALPAPLAGTIEEHPALGPGRGVFRKRSR